MALWVWLYTDTQMFPDLDANHVMFGTDYSYDSFCQQVCPCLQQYSLQHLLAVDSYNCAGDGCEKR